MRVRITTTLIYVLAVGGLLAAWAGGAFAAPQTHASVASVCPAKDKQPTSNGQRGTTGKIVPTGAHSVVVCSYLGANATKTTRAFQLLAFGHAGPTKTAKFISDLNALKPFKGVINCPMDDGTAVIAHFRYASGPDYLVRIGVNGCNSITNGKLGRLGLDKPFVSKIAGVAAKSVAHLGRIQGKVQTCGGPAPGGCRTGTVTDCTSQSRKPCFTDNRVELKTLAGKLVATAAVKHGRFCAYARPGSYKAHLIWTDPKTGSQHHGWGTETQKVILKAHRVAKVTLTVPVP